MIYSGYLMTNLNAIVELYYIFANNTQVNFPV